MLIVAAIYTVQLQFVSRARGDWIEGTNPNMEKRAVARRLVCSDRDNEWLMAIWGVVNAR